MKNMSEKRWNGYKGTTMTKKDEAVFAKAFEKMEAKGYFKELQTKNKLFEMLNNIK